MRALWLEAGRLRLRRDAPPPEPRDGEALVRVLCAGICNTDLELVRGYYPFTGVLGHEFVGRVEAGADDLVGVRVVGEINAVCHRCSACTNGRPTHCQNRTVLGIVGRHGAFADRLRLPLENLHRVPDAVPDDAAVFAEPLAAALQIQQQVAISDADRVVVVGDGKLGLLVLHTLARTPCDLTAVGHHPERLRALAPAGVTVADTPAAAAFDVAVECSGRAEGFISARRALRPRGTLVLKSTYAGDLTLDAAALVVDEITVVGSRCGPFPEALRLLQEGGLPLAGMVDDRFDLDDGEAAFRRAAEPGVLKVLLRVSED